MKFQFGSWCQADPTKPKVMAPDAKDASRSAAAGNEARPSRRSEWLARIKSSTHDGFPDGAVVTGGLFIRNDEQSTIVSAEQVATEPMEIKRPVSKRLHNWLSFFYPPSPPSPKMNTSPAQSTTGSDVEVEPITTGTASPLAKPGPRKGILKRPKPSDLLCIDQFAMEIDLIQQDTVASTVSLDSACTTCSHSRHIVFTESVLVETFSREEYNRSAIDYIARSLTPAIATLIKKELNEVKADMEVHELSRHHTQFYQVKS